MMVALIQHRRLLLWIPEMTPDLIYKYFLKNYPDTIVKTTWGEASIFVNPNQCLPSGTYFATIKTNNGPNDKASKLDRANVFRLNIGIGKPLFQAVFGAPPARPAKGQIIKGPWDFSQINLPMPHPVYGWMSWICVLNPTPDTFKALKPWLDTSYAKARKACLKRISSLRD